MKVEKVDENYYPSEFLTTYHYNTLAEDNSLNTYENEKILRSVLEDEEGMLKFLKNCSLDP